MTMTPQERDVIAGIFDRLRQAANQPRDPEAENFIAERLREQPYAAYAMAQSIYVQEQALANLQAQAQQLQAEVEALRRQPAAAPAPAQSGGFLSGIFGGASQPARSGSVPSFPQRAAPQPAPAQPASPPWGSQPGQQGMAAAPAPGPWQSQQAQAPARGGFMASALTTAAGVAGGMVAGNLLMNAFGGGKSASSEAKPAEASTAQQNDTATAENAQPASNQSYEDPGHSYQEPSYQNASNEGYDDGSSGFGDDEWA
jgi:hypothetical protein